MRRYFTTLRFEREPDARGRLLKKAAMVGVAKTPVEARQALELQKFNPKSCLANCKLQLKRHARVRGACSSRARRWKHV